MKVDLQLNLRVCAQKRSSKAKFAAVKKDLSLAQEKKIHTYTRGGQTIFNACNVKTIKAIVKQA